MDATKIIAIFSAFLLVSCVSSGVKVDQSKLSSMQPGVTTYDDVVANLGQPTNTIIQSDGTRMAVYSYIHSQATAVTFIPIVGAFAGGSNTESTTLTMRFDKYGKLIDYTSSQGTQSAGTGLVNGQAQ